MATDYPIRFAAQLRQHLKAFRKARKLTQAQLGELVGVSQARIAEIEAKPGVVSFDQLMQILSALGVAIILSEDLSTWQVPVLSVQAKRATPAVPAARHIHVQDVTGNMLGAGNVLPRYALRLPGASWGDAEFAARQVPVYFSGAPTPTTRSAESVPATEPDPRPVPAQSAPRTQPAAVPASDAPPVTGRNFSVRPKKGTW